MEDKMAELPCVGFYLFGVEDKMAELPCVGFYLFGVEDKMEAYHHVEPIWGEGGHDGGPPSWQSQFGVEDKMAELLCVGFYLFGWRTRWRSSLV